jgi:hypothetical protein
VLTWHAALSTHSKHFYFVTGAIDNLLVTPANTTNRYPGYSLSLFHEAGDVSTFPTEELGENSTHCDLLWLVGFVKFRYVV